MNPRQINPHIALSVAAGIAHQQLAAKPRAFYDGELADGRSFRHVSLLRDDLRSAIALLANTGIRAFGTPRTPR